MKVLLVGKNSKDIKQLVKNLGFEVVSQNPEVVISYGGDGTLLHAERDYPGIPKLPIRDSKVCTKCSNHKDEVLLNKLINNQLQLKDYQKLETNFSDKILLALNDFVIRNEQATHAIRFKVKSDFYIGDGIVVATPFGSTGYFKSITHQTFEKGFGVAFNNTTEKTQLFILKDEESVTFQLVRGKATLSFDNNPEICTVDENSDLIFKLSDQVARIYKSESLRCPNCEVIRG